MYGIGAIYFLYARAIELLGKANSNVRTLAVVNIIGLAAGRIPYVRFVPFEESLYSADGSWYSSWLQFRLWPQCRFVATALFRRLLTNRRRMTSLLISRFILQLRKGFSDAVLQSGGGFQGTTGISSISFIPLADLDSQGRSRAGEA